MTSALAQSYINNNIVHGHDRDCGFGAGADCYCSVYLREEAEQARLDRITYRLRQEDSGLDRGEFRALVLALAETFADLPGHPERSEVVSAAKIVGGAYWLAGHRFSKVLDPCTVVVHAVEDFMEYRAVRGLSTAVPADLYAVASAVEERVEALRERIRDWSTDWAC